MGLCPILDFQKYAKRGSCRHLILFEISGSSAPKKKTCCGKKKVAQDDFQGGRSLPFNFGPSFDLVNIIIWTSPSVGKLFKIKFYSQVALNGAICMDGLKATD